LGGGELTKTKHITKKLRGGHTTKGRFPNFTRLGPGQTRGAEGPPWGTLGRGLNGLNETVAGPHLAGF